MNKATDIINQSVHQNNDFQQLMEEGHRFAQKYGHSEGGVHNGETDAFRHAYSHAYLAYKKSELSSKLIGDSYELLGQNPDDEKIMDFYNNQVGREIGGKLLKNIKSLKFKNENEIKEYLAYEVEAALKNNQIITNLKDKRIKATMKNIPNHPLRVYTREDIDKMTTKEFEKNEKAINKQLETFGIPKEQEAKQAVQDGSMIWVDSYTRDDGTKVNGYYRSK